MIKSMTGYGRSEASREGDTFIVETKSVNHRNIEVIIRLPYTLNPLEVEIRKMVSEKITRGRVEVNIRAELDTSRRAEENMEINLPLIRNYFNMLNQIKRDLDLKDEITLNMISNFKDAFTHPESEVNVEEIWKHLENVLGDAMNALIEMRSKEGEILYRDFIERLTLIRQYLDNLKSRAPRVVLDYKDRLSERIAELTEDLEIDEARLSQEVAMMAEKSDITEEIVRFESHMHQFTEMLEGNDAMGRKMDFLLQEMVREINTIGSKSNDLQISRAVIEIKTELAKLREQAQNVE